MGPEKFIKIFVGKRGFIFSSAGCVFLRPLLKVAMFVLLLTINLKILITSQGTLHTSTGSYRATQRAALTSCWYLLNLIAS